MALGLFPGTGWCVWMGDGGTCRLGRAQLASPPSAPATCLSVTLSVGLFEEPTWLGK